MLNIRPKKDVLNSKNNRLSNFYDIQSTVFKNNLSRDKEIILNDILPKLHNAIAINKYFYDADIFHFTLPLIDFSDLNIYNEDKEKIIQNYYFKYTTLWGTCGQLGERSICNEICSIFKEILGFDIFFRSYEIDRESNLVLFELRLFDKLKKIKTNEEKELIKFMDGYLSELVDFEVYQKTIINCQHLLSEDGLLVIDKKDLDSYPVIDIQLHEILSKTRFFDDLHLNFDFNLIKLDEYIKNSKHLQSINRKLKEYGYQITTSLIRNEENVFRPIGINFGFSVSSFNKEPKKDLLPTSDSLTELFDKKMNEYHDTLNNKAKHQNEAIVQRVKDGEFDEYIATVLAKGTIMSPSPINSAYLYTRRGSDGVELKFSIPFDRHLENAIKFNPSSHVSYGVGSAYMNLEGNIIDALKDKHGFLSNSSFYGDKFYDFEENEHHLSDDSLDRGHFIEFFIKFDNTSYILQREVVLNFIAEQFGKMDIEVFLAKIQFNELGISEKIEHFVSSQEKGEIAALNKFKIVLASIDFDELKTVFANSQFHPKIEELLEEKHEDKFWLYRRSSDEYTNAKHEEFYNLKLSNLLVYSLEHHPTFKKMKKELSKFDYELKVDFLKEHKTKMKTGNSNINNEPMWDSIDNYTVQIIIC